MQQARQEGTTEFTEAGKVNEISDTYLFLTVLFSVALAPQPKNFDHDGNSYVTLLLVGFKGLSLRSGEQWIF
jgi:hypothetical protein